MHTGMGTNRSVGDDKRSHSFEVQWALRPAGLPLQDSSEQGGPLHRVMPTNSTASAHLRRGATAHKVQRVPLQAHVLGA